MSRASFLRLWQTEVEQTQEGMNETSYLSMRIKAKRELRKKEQRKWRKKNIKRNKKQKIDREASRRVPRWFCIINYLIISLKKWGGTTSITREFAGKFVNFAPWSAKICTYSTWCLVNSEINISSRALLRAVPEITQFSLLHWKELIHVEYIHTYVYVRYNRESARRRRTSRVLLLLLASAFAHRCGSRAKTRLVFTTNSFLCIISFL